MELDKKHQKLFLWEGTLLVILGILAILWPNVSMLAIEMIIGWLCILGGLIQGIKYFQMHKGVSSIFSLFIALFYVLFGVLIIAFPNEGIVTLTLLLAILFFAQGIFQILLAFRFKGAPFRIGTICSGLVAIILSVLIWSKWPMDSAWVLGLLVGVNLIFFGISQIFTVSKIPR